MVAQYAASSTYTDDAAIAQAQMVAQYATGSKCAGGAQIAHLQTLFTQHMCRW